VILFLLIYAAIAVVPPLATGVSLTGLYTAVFDKADGWIWRWGLRAAAAGGLGLAGAGAMLGGAFILSGGQADLATNLTAYLAGALVGNLVGALIALPFLRRAYIAVRWLAVRAGVTGADHRKVFA